MWVTPGARGVWVDKDGGVPCGEVVALRSAPQRSEGDEGEFVLVRRQCGARPPCDWLLWRGAVGCTSPSEVRMESYSS